MSVTLHKKMGISTFCRPGYGAIKSVIFDLGGTLVDSAPDSQVALNELLVEEGFLTLEEVSAMIGDGAPKLVERAMNATGEGMLWRISRC